MGCRLQLLQGPFADTDTERNSRWQLHHHWMHLKGPARGTAYRRVCPWSGLSSLWTGLSIHARAGPSVQGTGLMMNMACHETRTSGSKSDLDSSVLVHELTFVTIIGRVFIDPTFPAMSRIPDPRDRTFFFVKEPDHSWANVSGWSWFSGGRCWDNHQQPVRKCHSVPLEGI